jgi:hypothetical protein
MTAQVTFETDYFEPVPGEEVHANQGRFGRALADWLAEQLRARGVDIEEVLAEDFGWVVMVSRKPYRLWLACGNTEGSRQEWIVFPVAEPSFLQRMFGRIDPGRALDDLWQHVADVVPTIPRVKSIVWE